MLLPSLLGPLAYSIQSLKRMKQSYGPFSIELQDAFHIPNLCKVEHFLIYDWACFVPGSPPNDSPCPMWWADWTIAARRNSLDSGPACHCHEEQHAWHSYSSLAKEVRDKCVCDGSNVFLYPSFSFSLHMFPSPDAIACLTSLPFFFPNLSPFRLLLPIKFLCTPTANLKIQLQ